MVDLIVGGIIVLVLGIAIRSIVIAKKKGVRCIGCPAAGTCSKQQKTSCECHTDETL